jgi:YHS domain-containing protein
MDVDPARAAGKTTHKGVDIYFCSLRCKESFDEDPEAALSKGKQAKGP